MQGHLKLDHLKRSQHVPALENISWIAQVVPNNRFISPGDAAPLEPRPRLPEGCIRFTEKPKVWAMLHSALRGPPTATCQEPAPMPLPPAETEGKKPTGPSPGKVSSGTHSSLSKLPLGALEEKLRDIHGKEPGLWQEREQVLWAVERQQATRVQKLEMLVLKQQRRVEYLESENRHLLNPDREPRPTIVGYLEGVSSTRAVILFPNCGTTTVYPMEQADIVLLDLQNRDPCLSSGTLWVVHLILEENFWEKFR